MSNINLYTPVNQIVLEATKGKKIKELKKTEFDKKIKDAIISGLITLGQRQESGQITVLCDCLIHELKTSKSHFTPDEICIAIDYGCKNKLTEITALTQPVMSLTNVLKFINLYNETIRRDAIHKEQAEQEKREKEISEIERIAKIEAFEAEIEKALMLPQKAKESLSTGLKATYYRHLDKLGRVKLSIEEKKLIYERAKRLTPVPEPDRNPFRDVAFGQKKQEAIIKELAEALAFEIL